MQRKSWEWSEPSYEEFETRRKSATYYRLFSVEGNEIPYKHGDTYGIKTYTLYKFWAENDDEAKTVLDEYVSSHPGDTKVFFGRSNYIHRRDMNGKIVMSDSISDSISDSFGRPDDENRFIGFLDGIWFKAREFLNDIRGFCKSLWYFIRHYNFKTWRSFQYNDIWNIDNSVLSLIENSVERLKKESHSYPNSYGDNEKNAIANWHAELDKLLLEIRLYQYCGDFGIFDENDKTMIEIDRKYHNIIPYVSGTFNDIDYVKLHEITQDHWRAIWTQWEKIGQNCWD